jgi:hypothetical protein
MLGAPKYTVNREDARHALREDDDVGPSHRVARRTLIPPTWRTNCQMVRSRQPTGVLILVV